MKRIYGRICDRSGMSVIKRVEKGKLKIFFSYAESIGKTQAMLKAAVTAKEQGIDVVVGFIAAQMSEQNIKLINQLEVLDPMNQNGFELDRALLRKPELLLIDEFKWN